MFLALLSFIIVIFTCTSAILTFKGHNSISFNTWNNVTPRNRCVGVIKPKYNVQGGGVNCIGLICNNCRFKNISKCKGCEQFIREKSLLDACVFLEKSSNNFSGCGLVALRRTRIVLITSVFIAFLVQLLF